jgi:hypothetical protein
MNPAQYKQNAATRKHGQAGVSHELPQHLSTAWSEISPNEYLRLCIKSKASTRDQINVQEGPGTFKTLSRDALNERMSDSLDAGVRFASAVGVPTKNLIQRNKNFRFWY